MGLFDEGPLRLGLLEVFADTMSDEPMVVTASRTGTLFVEAAAVVEGDATLTVLVDDEPVAVSRISGPGRAPIYAYRHMTAVEAYSEHRVALEIDGTWVAGSPRLRVSDEAVVQPDLLSPGWPS
jgi:hypothetical protein